MRFISTYFGSEYSFAHFKNRFDSLTKIFFLPNFEVLLVSYGGNCSRITFDKTNGGQCQEKNSANFISRGTRPSSKITSTQASSEKNLK